jgi:hypothetical protein
MTAQSAAVAVVLALWLAACGTEDVTGGNDGATDEAGLARQVEDQVNKDYPEVRLTNTSCIKKSDTEYTCLGDNVPANTIDGPRSSFNVTVDPDTGSFIYEQAP